MIIGISGKIGCGKSTLARLLLERLGARWERHAFGDCLKEEAARTFGFPVEWAYSEWGKAQEVSVPACVVPADSMLRVVAADTLTVREILQWYGTDVCRKSDPEYWNKRMYERINPVFNVGRSVLVDDVRFPDECQLLRTWQFSCLLVRIEPYHGWKPGPHADHPSETALDDYHDWDLVLRPEFGGLAAAADQVKEFNKIVLGR